jgi:integrase
MAIVQKCVCGKNNGEKRKKCSNPVCGKDLVQLRKDGKIKFYVVTRINEKQEWEYAGTTLTEAQESEGKRKSQVRENKILEIQADGTMLLGQVIEDYLALTDTKIARGKEKATYNEIVRTMRNGLTTVFGKVMAKDLTNQMLIDFVLEKGKKNAPATVAKALVYLKAAVRKAVRAKKIPVTTEFAFDGIKIGQLLGDVNRPREFVLTPEQYRGLIENAPNEKYRSIFEILAHTGMRKGELNGITWGDVDLEKGVVTLRPEITKTSQAREVPLNIHASGAFRRVMGRWAKDKDKTSEKVFGFAKKTWGGKVLQQTCEKAGIPYGSNSGGFGYHTFGHSFITHSELDAWVPPAIVRAITGHTSDKSDAHNNYVHPTPENLRRGINQWTQWWDANVVTRKNVDDTLDIANPKVVKIR